MSAKSPVSKLKQFGQSIWLDYIERRILEDGTLRHMIQDDGVCGMTSNPAIFEKAIVDSHDYDAAIRELTRRQASSEEMYERLAIYDVKKAADLFEPVFQRNDGGDGFVSLEVSPRLAHDTGKTIDEARRLWRLLERPNVMIKVPGTREGLPAIRALIAEGININVTLLFSVKRYKEVTEQYIAGLEDRLEANRPVDHIASVASFFLSRIDSKVDPLLDKLAESGDADKGRLARDLRGQAAIASAGLAYGHWREIFGDERWQRIAASGGRKQRLLWASTSTKDPSYSDVKYVESLIGPDTVNTVPMQTLSAYRDHGHPEARLQQVVEQAPRLMQQLGELGIDIEAVDAELENEGVRKFVEPFDHMLETLEQVKH
ncbi:MAG: transaldolase [Gammaproteobacteria bacterium]